MTNNTIIIKDFTHDKGIKAAKMVTEKLIKAGMPTTEAIVEGNNIFFDICDIIGLELPSLSDDEMFQLILNIANSKR